MERGVNGRCVQQHIVDQAALHSAKQSVLMARLHRGNGDLDLERAETGRLHGLFGGYFDVKAVGAQVASFQVLRGIVAGASGERREQELRWCKSGVVTTVVSRLVAEDLVSADLYGELRAR